jgi:hypothetical protein
VAQAGPLPTVYVDENVPDQLVHRLRALGIQTTLARDIMPPATPDADHLKCCADNSWVLITLDQRDFQRLHWLWVNLHSWQVLSIPHAGIISAIQGPPLPDEWAPSIAALVRDHAASLTGAMWVWNHGRKEWWPQKASWEITQPTVR